MKKGKNPKNQGGEDKALWERVARTVNSYEKKAPKVPALPPPINRPPQPTGVAPHPPVTSSKPSPPSAGFDKGWEDKLARGHTHVEARLDLHGMNQSEAYVALLRFVTAQQKIGRRTLIVITGKGRTGEGVLRRLLPLWLEDVPLRKHVVAFTTAKEKDGGAGAFYIRLRRGNKKKT